jgi:hypothetical protein
MRRLALVLAIAGLLSFSSTALAGGWANVKLSDLPPVNPTAGQTWTVDLDIKQHGVTPMSGIRPAVLLKADDGTEKRFPARPMEKVGLYRATVRWPSGRWTMHVDDGFTNAFPHKYPTIQVGPPAAAPAAVAESGTSALVWIALAAGVAATLLLPALFMRRRRTLLT